MKKSAQVVMFPTNEKALNLTPIVMYNNKLFSCYSGNYSYDKAIFQNLYILSDEEIKEGDWCYGMDGIFQYKGKVNLPDIELPKKIIATTDKLNIHPNLADSYRSGNCLPQIPQSFIEHFVSEYNKGNVITEVMVEYEWNKTGRKIRKLDVFDHILKINSDNTINISMPKDSWSRDEVKHLLECVWNEGAFWGSSKPNSHYFDKWIEENL